MQIWHWKTHLLYFNHAITDLHRASCKLKWLYALILAYNETVIEREQSLWPEKSEVPPHPPKKEVSTFSQIEEEKVKIKKRIRRKISFGITSEAPMLDIQHCCSLLEHRQEKQPLSASGSHSGTIQTFAIMYK